MNNKFRNKEFEEKIAKNKKEWDGFLKTVSDTVEELKSIYEPFWRARIDFMKILITVSTAALAVLVGFSKSILSINTPFVEVFVSLIFVALLTAIITGISGVWFATQIFAVPIWLINRHHAFLKGIEAMKSKGKWEEGDFLPIPNEPFERVGKYDIKAKFLLNVSMYSYFATLFLFTVFFFTLIFCPAFS